MVLTTDLLTNIRDQVKTQLGVLMKFGAAGEDGTTPAASDTELGLEVFRDTLDSFDTSVSDSVTASLRIGTTEANNNTIREYGLFDLNTLTVDNCDSVTGWADSADMTISVNTSEFKENSASLNLTKDAGTVSTAFTEKTTTSQSFLGDNANLAIWIFVIDAPTLALLAVTNALEIRFGSDSSNYYQWDKDNTDLIVGWNLVKDLTIANASSTTGTPIDGAMDYTRVTLNTTAAGDTWTAGDVIMDDIRIIQGTLWSRNVILPLNKTDDIQIFLDNTIKITVDQP